MVIIKISGGLGNQLFQYSFGRNLAILFNTDLKLDICTVSNADSFTNRDYGLNHFHISAAIASQYEVCSMRHFTKGLFKRIERKIIQGCPKISNHYFVEKYRYFDQNSKYFRDNCYYDGYWQSEKYFLPVKDIIKKDLAFKITLDNANKDLLNKILKYRSVGIHVRRSDYLINKANKKIFTTCTLDYYKSAIDLINSCVADAVFFVFADDPSWAKANLKGESFVFVNNNSDYPEIDLHLMSQCKHNIIANSTFSWWGAWLNSHQDKIVIASKNWYVGRLNKFAAEIIPEDWVKL